MAAAGKEGRHRGAPRNGPRSRPGWVPRVRALPSGSERGEARRFSAPVLETLSWFGLIWFGLFLRGWRDPHEYSRARGKAQEINSGEEEKNKKQPQVWIRGQKGSACVCVCGGGVVHSFPTLRPSRRRKDGPDREGTKLQNKGREIINGEESPFLPPPPVAG